MASIPGWWRPLLAPTVKIILKGRSVVSWRSWDSWLARSGSSDSSPCYPNFYKRAVKFQIFSRPPQVPVNTLWYTGGRKRGIAYCALLLALSVLLNPLNWSMLVSIALSDNLDRYLGEYINVSHAAEPPIGREKS